jgi:RNA recognition motif-containing protein
MRIFVGNLSYGTTEDTLRGAFESYGEVGTVAVITAPDTGRSRGFGFVEMPNEQEGRAAITGLNGKIVDGRPLNVDEAQSRHRDSRSRR